MNDMTQDGSAFPGGSETTNMNPTPAFGMTPAAVQKTDQSGNDSVASTSIQNNMNTNNNDNVPADDESAATRLEPNGGISPLSDDGGLPQPLSGNYNEPGNSSMDPVSGTFSIPEGGALMTLSLTVDDWGTIVVSGPGGSYSLNMSPENSYPDGEAGPRGGARAVEQDRIFPPAPRRVPIHGDAQQHLHGA